MSYYTRDSYEVKREITTFSTKMSKGLSKPKEKFMLDMQYGIAGSQSILISEISRSLNEKNKLKHTIERLCDNLVAFSDVDYNCVMDNYMQEVKKHTPTNPLILLDDTEIVKQYGLKFEDLCYVVDGSSNKKADVKPGYHVCEAVVVSKNEKQPIPIYSHIYSTESDGFKSKPNETLKSIYHTKKYFPERCTFVLDRGYDTGTFYNFFLKDNNNQDDFVIRVKSNRTLLFKGKKRSVGEVSKQRKGKVGMKMQFSENEMVMTYLSHTRVQLPTIKDKELQLVIVYGLSETKPMILLTNKAINSKEDLIKIVRCYMSRWRIEENFRHKKTSYQWESMRVRRLSSMNALNLFLMIKVGHIAMLADKINEKLLAIKIIERSKSLRNNILLWSYQLSSGIKEILNKVQCGIEHFQRVEKSVAFRQLSLKI